MKKAQINDKNQEQLQAAFETAFDLLLKERTGLAEATTKPAATEAYISEKYRKRY